MGVSIDRCITLSTHCNLYRQQICAIFFLFSALEAEIIMSLGLSWPFFFLLKRLFTITINYSRTERMMRRRATITVGVTADSAVTPTVIVV